MAFAAHSVTQGSCRVPHFACTLCTPSPAGTILVQTGSGIALLHCGQSTNPHPALCFPLPPSSHSSSCPLECTAGNILVQKGGGIALLDYGQSKQLPPKERTGVAHLVLAMHRWVDGGVCSLVSTSVSIPALQRGDSLLCVALAAAPVGAFQRPALPQNPPSLSIVLPLSLAFSPTHKHTHTTMHSGKEAEVDAALTELGIVTEKNDPAIRSRLAYGMFDTRGKVGEPSERIGGV